MEIGLDLRSRQSYIKNSQKLKPLVHSPFSQVSLDRSSATLLQSKHSHLDGVQNGSTGKDHPERVVPGPLGHRRSQDRLGLSRHQKGLE